MKDERKMTKWIPFDSVMNTKTTINQINKQKQKQKIPILSIDQLEDLNYIVKHKINNKLPCLIKFYNKGVIEEFQDYITTIDEIKKRIIFKNNPPLHVSQIINII